MKIQNSPVHRGEIDTQKFTEDKTADFIHHLDKLPLEPVGLVFINPLPGAAGFGVKPEAGAAAGEENAVQELRVKPQTGLGEHTGQVVHRRLVGKGIAEYILLRVAVASSVTGTDKSTLAGKVVLLPLGLIAEYGIGFVDFFEALFGLLFIARIGIRVVLEGKLSEGFLYLLVAGVLRNAEDFIVIFHIIVCRRLLPMAYGGQVLYWMCVCCTYYNGRVKKMKIRLLITAIVILTCLPGSGCGQDSGLDADINSIIADYSFDLFDWELDALSGELDEMLFGNNEYSADDSIIVLEYFSIVEQVTALNYEIEAVKSGVAEGDLASLEDEMSSLLEYQQLFEIQAEKIIEKQIRETLDQTLGEEAGFPPVNFIIEEPPKVLVVSPRDSIDSIKEITLDNGLTTEHMESIEEAIDELGVSSLIINVGGMATYPAFVTVSTNLKFTINAAIEEWLHQYLFFKPLGFLYALDQAGVSRNYEIATMNETLAGIVSDELGDILYQNYYARYEETEVQGEDAGEAETGFDFYREMREIRLQVDEYLAQGEIEQAEAYMEQKRLYIISQGYYIRKLNQAYFAFYGAYADSPGSVDPIGDEMRQLRSQYDSVKDFLNDASLMDSRSDLTDSIEVDGD